MHNRINKKSEFNEMKFSIPKYRLKINNFALCNHLALSTFQGVANKKNAVVRKHEFYEHNNGF